MMPSCPFVVIPEDVSAESLAMEKPMLLMAIETVTQPFDEETRLKLSQTFREDASRRVFTDGEKTLDLLQGILVYLAWYV